MFVGSIISAILIAGLMSIPLEMARAVAIKRGQPAKNQRFLDHGDYVEDSRTGLLWQKGGAVSGKKNFYDAAKYAAQLKLGRMAGWRVPTKDELAAIFPATDAPFRNTKYTDHACCTGPHEWNSYWTSNLDRRLPDYAYVYQWYARAAPITVTPAKILSMLGASTIPSRRSDDGRDSRG